MIFLFISSVLANSVFNGIQFSIDGNHYSSTACAIDDDPVLFNNLTISLAYCSTQCLLASQNSTTITDPVRNVLCTSYAYNHKTTGCYFFDRSIATLNVVSESGVSCGNNKGATVAGVTSGIFQGLKFSAAADVYSYSSAKINENYIMSLSINDEPDCVSKCQSLKGQPTGSTIPTSNNTSSADSSATLRLGLEIGIPVGTVLLLLVVGGLLFYKKRKQKDSDTEYSKTPASVNSSTTASVEQVYHEFRNFDPTKTSPILNPQGLSWNSQLHLQPRKTYEGELPHLDNPERSFSMIQPPILIKSQTEQNNLDNGLVDQISGNYLHPSTPVIESISPRISEETIPRIVVVKTHSNDGGVRPLERASQDPQPSSLSGYSIGTASPPPHLPRYSLKPEEYLPELGYRQPRVQSSDNNLDTGLLDSSQPPIILYDLEGIVQQPDSALTNPNAHSGQLHTANSSILPPLLLNQ
ncbi:hypothetical protein HDV06_007069 [Boothiomyces sp. JEL0866]|nr:hypothetical protein HDV06_007069 [Boothiomyces sp. JEL0866]